MIFDTQIALAKYAGKKRSDSITKAFKDSSDGTIILNINGENLRFKRMPKISSKE
jgi:hypothetical protein